MILVFGGTTEGRDAAKTLAQSGKPFYYSTKGENQELYVPNMIRLTGAMDRDAIESFIKKENIRLIIDAAHPFATELHQNIFEAAEATDVDIVRYGRRFNEVKAGDMIMCDSFDDAIGMLEKNGVKRLLALTGVQTIGALKQFWKSHLTYFRILDRDDSRLKASLQGFPLERIIYYDPEDPGAEKAIEEIHPDAVITKESGESGGFNAKLLASKRAGIRLYVVRHPVLKEVEAEVYGTYGLRRAVERLLPGFFDLRTGFTTGSCATAASKAALEALLTGKKSKKIDFELPDGEIMEMPIVGYRNGNQGCTATVMKDAGDDPDVTNMCRISALVERVDGKDIEIKGGTGIGTVTLPGLGIPVGEAAINPTPRKMINDNLRKIYPVGGLRVTISVENGEKLAERTFNPKVGIVGGISIIGTTGIVSPFSHEAFIESIRREISVAKASGVELIVLNSGARSEKVVRSYYPNLPDYAFIHYGNAIGETLEAAEKARVRKIAMGIMIGKAVKLAEGHLNTHSHNVNMNKDFLVDIARQANIPSELIEYIKKTALARQLWQLIPAEEYESFYELITKLCHMHATRIFSGQLTIHLIRD